MRYLNMKQRLLLNGVKYKFGEEIKDFENIPYRNQSCLLDMGWVKAVAVAPDEPIARKSMTKRKVKAGG